MAVLSAWCCNPREISGKRITPATLRDELVLRVRVRFGFQSHSIDRTGDMVSQTVVAFV